MMPCRAALGGADLPHPARSGRGWRRVHPRKRSRTRGVEARLIGPARSCPRSGNRHRVEFVRPLDEPGANRLPAPGTLRRRPPVQSPYLVPLVEVVGGEKTGSEAIERAIAFYTAIGKQ